MGPPRSSRSSRGPPPPARSALTSEPSPRGAFGLGGPNAPPPKPPRSPPPPPPALAAAAPSAVAAAAPALAASAAALAPSAAARFAPGAAAAGVGHEVDHEIMLGDLDAAARLGLAAEDAHQPHARRAIADRLDRFDQPRQPIAGDARRLADLLAELLGRDALADEPALGLARLPNGQTTELGDRA